MEEKFYQFDGLNNRDIVSLYTKIPFNFSRKYVKKEKIDREFEEIMDSVGYEWNSVKYMKQVHGNNIKIVREEDLDIDCYEGYDGMITDIRGIALSTITADCQAIFLYDKVKKVIGNVHSGWKGTLKRIVRMAIEVMIDEYGSKVEDIAVYFNPSILDCCFEVEDDVVECYRNEFKNVDKYIMIGEVKDGKQKYYIDTIGINRDEILEMGILERNIFRSNICTKCNAIIYHSYRNEGIGTGQNLALICLK